MKAMLRRYLIRKLKIAVSYSDIFTFMSIRRSLFDRSILLSKSRVSQIARSSESRKHFPDLRIVENSLKVNHRDSCTAVNVRLFIG